MNPIKFIYEDFKSDFKAIYEIMNNISNGKPVLTEAKRERFRKAFCEGWDTFLKDNWMLFLIIILAFASGYFIAGKHYQDVCNQYIYMNYIEPSMENVINTMYNFTLNMTG